MEHEVLLGLGTGRGSDWRGRIREFSGARVKRVALFLSTRLSPLERTDLYRLLDLSGLEIPQVHLVPGMEPWELDVLKGRGAELFNIHAEWGDEPAFLREAGAIYVENRYRGFSFDTARRFAGICLDFAHAELGRTVTEALDPMEEIPEDLAIGCCHVSGLPSAFEYLSGARDEHVLRDPAELSYLAGWRGRFPRYLALELKNGLAEQRAAKRFLEDRLEEWGG